MSEVDADARVRRDDLLAHARVLESLVESSTVLPMRFGVIVETDELVAHNILEAGGSRLTSLLNSFDGSTSVQRFVGSATRPPQALPPITLSSGWARR